MAYLDNKALFVQEFLNREINRRHHKYDQELQLYTMLQRGDPDCIDIACDLLVSDLSGHLSSNPLQNYQLLFVASTTLATRFSIEGGMDEEKAYNASDLFIRRVIKCQELDEVFRLYREMITHFCTRMSKIHKQSIYSRTVTKAIDYIYYHLHEKITIDMIADEIGISANYLSSLFKKETGFTINNYITEKRIEAAKNMLLYSDLDYAEIATILAFSSQSHFTKVFHQKVGVTPRYFRNRSEREGFLMGKAYVGSDRS